MSRRIWSRTVVSSIELSRFVLTNPGDTAVVRTAPDPPQQAAVGIGHGDDLVAAGTTDDRVGLAATSFDATFPSAPATEALALVVANDGAVAFTLAEAIARLLDDRAAALVARFLGARS